MYLNPTFGSQISESMRDTTTKKVGFIIKLIGNMSSLTFYKILKVSLITNMLLFYLHSSHAPSRASKISSQTRGQHELGEVWPLDFTHGPTCSNTTKKVDVPPQNQLVILGVFQPLMSPYKVSLFTDMSLTFTTPTFPCDTKITNVKHLMEEDY